MDSASRQVVQRFVIKTALLVGFALLRWSEGPCRVAMVLFLSAAVLNVLIALLKCEQWTWNSLSYWDEALAFLFLTSCVFVACPLSG